MISEDISEDIGPMPLPRTSLRPMLFAALLCALLTIPIAWNERELISSDGLAYLEVGANAAQLGPGYLISNAYWSPVYPAILAVAMKVAHPSLPWELGLVHAIDWGICAATYLAFTSFLWNLLRWIRAEHGPVFRTRRQFLALLALLYTLLFVGNTDITLWLVGPHILIEGVVYLIAAAAIRLNLPAVRLRHHVWLGVLLAFGYATKTVLFPLALVLLALLFVTGVLNHSGRKGIVLAGMVFLIGASPLVAFLSYHKGRLTFGDAGSLTYAFYVSGVPRYWEKGPPPPPLPHVPEKIFDSPRILKFAAPFSATYSYWYDPSWWYEGVHPPFDPRRQAQQFLRVLGLYPKFMLSGISVFQLAARWMPVWAGLITLGIFGFSFRRLFRALAASQTWLLLWPASAFFAFASVSLEFRYVVPFFMLGFATLFIAAAQAIKATKWTGITLTVTAGLLLVYGPGFARELRKIPHHSDSENALVARKLQSLGIHPGDQLAGVGFADYAYYARLAGARFTIQIAAENRSALSRLPAAQVQSILAVLRAHGARALYSPYMPAFDNDTGWLQVSPQGFIRLL